MNVKTDKEDATLVYSVDTIRENLPKGYRLHTYLGDLDGPIGLFPDRVVVQSKIYKTKRIFGFIPFKRRQWVNIGEFSPSIIGLTIVPIFVVYRKFEKNIPVLSKIFENTQFKIVLQNS